MLRTRRCDCWALSSLAIAFGAALLFTPMQPAESADWHGRAAAVFDPEDADYAYDPALYSGLEWRNVGPYRGGRVVAVAGHADQPHTFYAGYVGGGVWKTTDAGESWQNVSDGYFASSSVGAIAVAPSDPNVVYVGMGEAPFRAVKSQSGDGVYKSTDGGKTWTHIGLANTHQISGIAVHPDNPNSVIVAAQGLPWKPTEDRGVYKTSDGGANWDKVLYVNDTTGASGLSMDPNNPRIIYAGLWDHRRLPWKLRDAGEGSGLWKSTDGGRNWTELTEGLPDLMGNTGVAVSGADSDRVYAYIQAEEGGIFRSDDAGQTWQRTNESRSLRMRHWYYTHIWADPLDKDTVYALNSEMDKSIDGGKTFTSVATPHSDNHALWINPENPDIMVQGNDGGANVTTNGGETWSTQYNQPTAQLYRVAVDDQFPYRLYTGQQDNTSIAIPSLAFDGGIGQDEWYPVGGGESSHVAFDPDNPRYIYATSILGTITEFDDQTKRSRSIQPWFHYPAFADASDLKYRFNWNPPVITSPHDRSVIYYAGNVLFRSNDRGNSWEIVSPDLTRNERDKQGLGSGPISIEGAGGEVYATVMTITESPHEEGVIYTGSDDGRVMLTRNGGESWQDVTPANVEDGIVNSIEVSPHDAGTVHITVLRHKFGDFKPYIFTSDDYGRRWRSIADGLPDSAYTRVLREDTVRSGLLYAGTFYGVFMSFDGGANWQPLQQNLPVVGITDLKVKDDDLVAATDGRSFWILDNLSPLRQLDSDIADSDVHLFTPAAALKLDFHREYNAGMGENPPNGAILDYYFSEAPDIATLEIVDDEGKVVRSFTAGEKAAEDEPAKKFGGAYTSKPLPAEAGMNRFVWDLRREPLVQIAEPFLYTSLEPSRVPPGTYTARLTVDDAVQTASFEVRPDPRIDIAAEAFAEHDALMQEIRSEFETINRTMNAAQSITDQVAHVISVTSGYEDHGQIAEAGQELIESLTEWRDQRDQPTVGEDFADEINYPNRSIAPFYLYLLNRMDDSGPPVTDPQRAYLAELKPQWQEIKAEFDAILKEDLKAFNAMIAEGGYGAVVVPPE